MKKKILNTILVIATLSIWGLILLRIFSFTDRKENVQTDFEQLPFGNDSLRVIDTIVIYNNYEDPFRKVIRVGKGGITPKMEIKVLQTKRDEKINWPDLEYMGLIENKKSKESFALLSLSEESYVIGENETIKGIDVVGIYKDSIKLRFQREERTFQKIKR